MRILVTGASGFVGSYLTELLLAKGHEVFGIDLKPHTDIKYKLYCIDINNNAQLNNIIDKLKPDQIYHLAASAFIPDSYENPKGTFETIIFGTVNILESLRLISPESKLLYVGSSDEYGINESYVPFDEQMLPKPCTPYAVAKLAASFICEQYSKMYNVNVVRTRSFNHCGPRQSPKFVSAGMARQIAIMEKSRGTELRIGNLTTSRDFLDVRDVVRAYYTIMQTSGNSGELYNVCSGNYISIKHVMERLLEVSMLPRDDVRIVIDAPTRKFDSDITIGNNAKLRALGWKPERNIDDTFAETLEYWRKNV